MNAIYWSLADDCAHWLCPGDLDAGRRELRAAIAEFETWFLRARLRWKQVRIGAGAFFTTSALALVLQYNAAGISTIDTTACAVAFALAVWAATWKLPRLIQQLSINWVKHHPFNCPKIEKLRNYLNFLANSERPLTAKDGTLVARDILRKEWALLFLTSNAKLHALPIFSDIDTELDSYPDGLFVERPTMLPANVAPNQAPIINLYVDQRASNLTLNHNVDQSALHTHYHFITQLRQDFSATDMPPQTGSTDQTSRTKKNVRWPCEFEKDDYELRLYKFERISLLDGKMIDSHKMQKFVIAIDGARSHWSRNAKMSIDELAEILGALVAKKTDGFAGLNRSLSVSWIKSVIGGTGEYAFVKTAFYAIQNDPDEFKDAQYSLLLNNLE